MSHEDLSRHHCEDWLKDHEAHFSRAKTKTIPLNPMMGPINYRSLKQLGSPGLIVEPPKHRTSVARIRVATPAQLRVVEKQLEPGCMGLPDAAYEGSRLADDLDMAKPVGTYSWQKRWQYTIGQTRERQE